MAKCKMDMPLPPRTRRSIYAVEQCGTVCAIGTAECADVLKRRTRVKSRQGQPLVKREPREASILFAVRGALPLVQRTVHALRSPP